MGFNFSIGSGSSLNSKIYKKINELQKIQKIQKDKTSTSKDTKN